MKLQSSFEKRYAGYLVCRSEFRPAAEKFVSECPSVSFSIHGSLESLLQAAASRPPEAIVLFEPDEQEVLGFVSSLQADADCRRARLFCIGGSLPLAARLNAYSLGVDDCLPSDFSPYEFQAKLSRLLTLRTQDEIDNTKDDFLGLLAHETKTPLNGIIGLTSIMLDDDTLEREELLEYVETIDKSGKDLLKLVDNIALLCDLKTSPRQEEPETFSGIADLVDALASEVVPDEDESEVLFRISVAEEMIPVRSDLLSITIRNILEQVFDYSPPGTEAYVLGEREADCYALKVWNPSFINHEQAKELFNEFSVSDINHHSRIAGLSMAVAKLIAESYGGSLEVASLKEQGTTFNLLLPLADGLRTQDADS